MRKILIAAFLISCVAGNSHAVTWKFIEGTPFYADLDSRQINGDIAEITVRIIDDPAPPNMVEFDCKLRRLINGNRAVVNDTPTEKLMKVACKRSWEFWK